MKSAISHIKSRCLTIGFTQSHDAVLLNSIAKAGSELGNFIYVDTEKQDYHQQIEDSIASSLAMSLTIDGLEVEISSNCMEFKRKFILEKHSL
jgi:hypothetical protein